MPLTNNNPQTITNGTKNKIASWLGIVILLIIAIIVWVIIFTYSQDSTDQTIIPDNTAQTSPSQTEYYSQTGQITNISNNQITINFEQNGNSKSLTGILDQQTEIFRLTIPKTNPEGQRSGKLFERQPIILDQVEIGDQATLKSYPNQPINDLETFLLKTIEIRNIL